MKNDKIVKGLQLLDDNLTQFDELCDTDGNWVDVHELIWETLETLQGEIVEIDDAAHTLMGFYPRNCDAFKIGEYTVYDHGDRLYSVRRPDRDAVILVHANSPHDAWRKAVEMYERRD